MRINENFSNFYSYKQEYDKMLAVPPNYLAVPPSSKSFRTIQEKL